VSLIRAARDGFEKSKEEKLISDSENSNDIGIELENRTQSAKVNHILPLMILVLSTGIFIAISSNGKKSDAAKKAYPSQIKTMQPVSKKNNSAITNKDKEKRLIELEKMLEKGLITKDEFTTLKANMLYE